MGKAKRPRNVRAQFRSTTLCTRTQHVTHLDNVLRGHRNRVDRIATFGAICPRGRAIVGRHIHIARNERDGHEDLVAASAGGVGADPFTLDGLARSAGRARGVVAGGTDQSALE